ncbi:hypothetical protein C0J52_07129 [Blattella germanica]|nr:hypothetical protein C0J52_07129 [Blattella germanica]
MALHDRLLTKRTKCQQAICDRPPPDIEFVVCLFTELSIARQPCQRRFQRDANHASLIISKFCVEKVGAKRTSLHQQFNRNFDHV